jgi:membrane protein YqaA with SNARE-associated domain
MLMLLQALLSLAFGGGAGWLLGRGVPRLVQRSGTLARRNQSTQLLFGVLLISPWLIGILAVVCLLSRFDLLFLVGGYWVGFLLARRRLGL